MPESPSLAWLLHPITKEHFFEEYWEKQPLVIKRNEPSYFDSLLSLEQVDLVLTTLDRRYPDVTLKNARRRLSHEEYTMAGDILDVAKVYQLFEEGSTITLAYLDTVLPALTLFCRHVEKEFSCPFQTNVYLTPPGAQGAKPHYDTHDVFVLQVAGSKKWTLYGTPVELPLPGQEFDASVHELGAPTQEFELNAGDVAYIPRGLAHDAHSTDVLSLHITAGVLRYTWADLLLEVVAGASLSDACFRKALPPDFFLPHFDRSRARETLIDLVQKACEPHNVDAALDQFVDRFLAASPPMLQGQMSQMASLDRLTVETEVGARPGVISRLQSNGDSASLLCYGRRITFPPQAVEAVRFALDTARFPVSDLPGNLDDAGKLTLVRRLIREGFVSALRW